ncbi:hypothetical protein NE619_09600 [Anaerovorax odorimutans]|uniref:Uncharacterized protein n=1 Tax=Anaerovorax odorimutans TaxID=109327 RepID=A0ABT1RP66_9FIRM|nr:hypothetical protein [Anaerovorax odorimutans]
MKKDPLLSLFFDESSGNSLLRYYAKGERPFLPGRTQPEYSRELRIKWFWICGQIPILPVHPATIVPKEASWSQVKYENLCWQPFWRPQDLWKIR